MKLSQEQIKFMLAAGPMILATASCNEGKGQPRTCIIRTSGILEDQIIIGDAEMGKTALNIKENNKVSLLSFASDYSRWLKISGEAQYFDDNKIIEENQNMKYFNPDFPLKGIIIVKITSVEDIAG